MAVGAMLAGCEISRWDHVLAAVLVSSETTNTVAEPGDYLGSWRCDNKLRLGMHHLQPSVRPLANWREEVHTEFTAHNVPQGQETSHDEPPRSRRFRAGPLRTDTPMCVLVPTLFSEIQKYLEGKIGVIKMTTRQTRNKCVCAPVVVATCTSIAVTLLLPNLPSVVA